MVTTSSRPGETFQEESDQMSPTQQALSNQLVNILRKYVLGLLI